MEKVCIIAQFPPPIHGLSKAVDTLYNSRLSEKYVFSKVDITKNSKFLKNLMKVIRNDSDLYYLTISQSVLGNIRDLIILRVLLLKKKKIIIHLHGGYYRNMLLNEGKFLYSLNKKIISKLDSVIVLANSLMYIFEDFISEDKIKVVLNCVDNEFKLSDNEFNEKLEVIKEQYKLNILYLSNFIESKGYKDVLQIAKIMKDRGIDKFNFVFSGKFFSKEEQDEFIQYLDKYGLSEIIKYNGVVSGTKKKEALLESNIFILPTRYPKEGQPISIIEGMSSGMAIFSTRHAGIPDLVTDEENGYLTNYNDYDKIIEKMLGLYNDRKKLIDMAINNRNKVNRSFTEENYIANLEKVFDEVLKVGEFERL